MDQTVKYDSDNTMVMEDNNLKTINYSSEQKINNR